jgi:ubiquinone/menaquinone biosynthesis C-methylase UbiE
MKAAPQIHLSDVQAVYSGAEGRLWELLMGEQIHIGGMQSSMDLAERAGIGQGQRGVDLCCATGAGMRFLVRFHEVEHMTGVDATRVMLDLGRRRCEEQGSAGRIAFVEADASRSELPSGQFDFVWGEDAWCYVEDKARLIAEVARLLKPGGCIAFTDWMEGSVGVVAEERQRLYGFMKFPNIIKLGGYCSLLQTNGCQIRTALDTGRFARFAKLYIDLLEQQLTYDALRIIGFDSALAQQLLGEMKFMQGLADSGKLIQGLIIAHKGGNGS